MNASQHGQRQVEILDTPAHGAEVLVILTDPSRLKAYVDESVKVGSGAVLCCAVLCCAVLCLCCVVLCCAVLHHAVLCCAASLLPPPSLQSAPSWHLPDAPRLKCRF